nr:hypothetical protein Iba_chr11bCG1300 [Ipomoea batatas]
MMLAFYGGNSFLESLLLRKAEHISTCSSAPEIPRFSAANDLYLSLRRRSEFSPYLCSSPSRSNHVKASSLLHDLRGHIPFPLAVPFLFLIVLIN